VAEVPAAADIGVVAPTAQPDAAPAASPGSRTLWIAAGAALLVLGAAAAVLMRKRRGKELSAAERQKLLEEIRRAIGDDEPADLGAKA
jgi:crotonobetainyl-CoA:carnitine CoA-transferase CaiB-like acyl-CoA transferase